MRHEDFFDDELNETLDIQNELECLKNKHIIQKSSPVHNEIEKEKDNGDRLTYIKRTLIFSNKYERAIGSLGETMECTRNILVSARTILEHHHGDRYEDLYFIDTDNNEILSRTDYKVKEKEVLPSHAMKTMAKGNPNIISLHNHPTDSLPSLEDIKTCYLIGYKYGLILCHNGNIYKYVTTDDINPVIYETEISIYYKKESELTTQLDANLITIQQLKSKHEENMNELCKNILDAGIILEEVLWNGDAQRHYPENNN